MFEVARPTRKQKVAGLSQLLLPEQEPVSFSRSHFSVLPIIELILKLISCLLLSPPKKYHSCFFLLREKVNNFKLTIKL